MVYNCLDVVVLDILSHKKSKWSKISCWQIQKNLHMSHKKIQCSHFMF